MSLYIYIRYKYVSDSVTGRTSYSSFLNLNAYEGVDQTMVMISERDYVFPIVFYQTGSVFSELAPTTPERTLEVLTELLGNLAKARSLK